jgi:hypothetical protein
MSVPKHWILGGWYPGGLILVNSPPAEVLKVLLLILAFDLQKLMGWSCCHGFVIKSFANTCRWFAKAYGMVLFPWFCHNNFCQYSPLICKSLSGWSCCHGFVIKIFAKTCPWFAKAYWMVLVAIFCFHGFVIIIENKIIKNTVNCMMGDGYCSVI